MKVRILLFALMSLLASPAWAGGPGCTATSSLSWYQSNPYYTIQPSDCIITATQADAGRTSLYTYLPASPSNGDMDTLKDATPYSFDNCDVWYSDPLDGGDGNTYSGCQPGGFTLQGYGDALVGDANDGYAQSLTLTEFYFVSCDVGDVEPETNPCGPEDLPYYYGDYPQQRYLFNVTFNSSTGNWDAVYTGLRDKRTKTFFPKPPRTARPFRNPALL